MKNIKKLFIMAIAVISIGSLSVGVFAKSNYNSPAEAAAGLSNKTVEAVRAERVESKKTYGEIAKDAGKLEEFKLERSEMRKDQLGLQVKNGKITQEKADEILANVEKRQENCDGEGFGKTKDGLRLHQNGHGDGLNNQGNKFQQGLRLQDGTAEKPGQ